MTNENIKIEDNFLDQEEFDKIQKTMMGDNFPWFLNVDQYLHEFHITHLVYFNSAPNGEIELMRPILDVLDPVSLFRIKANLITKTPEIVESEWHSDMMFLLEEKREQWTTSIFYVNTNNGYTKFEDGTKVESVANRMVTFPVNMKHLGATCTDQHFRTVINFLYFKNTL